MIEVIFVAEKDFSLRAQEVVREMGEKPFLMLRVTLVGPHFPHRGAYPFLRVAGAGVAGESLMAEISADQKELNGYFPLDVKLSGRLEFGYGGQVLGSVPIAKLEPRQLDRSRLEKDVGSITLKDLGPFKRAR